jgi:hypothetical protein
LFVNGSPIFRGSAKPYGPIGRVERISCGEVSGRAVSGEIALTNCGKRRIAISKGQYDGAIDKSIAPSKATLYLEPPDHFLK